MKMKAVISLLFLYSLPFIHCTQAMFTGPMLYSGPGLLGLGIQKATLTAARPPPRLEDPCENAANRQTQIPWNMNTDRARGGRILRRKTFDWSQRGCHNVKRLVRRQQLL